MDMTYALSRVQALPDSVARTQMQDAIRELRLNPRPLIHPLVAVMDEAGVMGDVRRAISVYDVLQTIAETRPDVFARSLGMTAFGITVQPSAFEALAKKMAAKWWLRTPVIEETNRVMRERMQEERAKRYRRVWS